MQQFGSGVGSGYFQGPNLPGAKRLKTFVQEVGKTDSANNGRVQWKFSPYDFEDGANENMFEHLLFHMMDLDFLARIQQLKMPGVQARLRGGGESAVGGSYSVPDVMPFMNIMKLNELLMGFDFAEGDDQKLEKLIRSISFVGVCVTPEQVQRSRSRKSQDVRAITLQGPARTYDVFMTPNEGEVEMDDMIFACLCVFPKLQNYTGSFKFNVGREVANTYGARSFPSMKEPKGNYYLKMVFYVSKDGLPPPDYMPNQDARLDPSSDAMGLVLRKYLLGRVQWPANYLEARSKNAAFVDPTKLDCLRDAIGTKLISGITLFLNPVNGPIRQVKISELPNILTKNMTLLGPGRAVVSNRAKNEEGQFIRVPEKPKAGLVSNPSGLSPERIWTTTASSSSEFPTRGGAGGATGEEQAKVEITYDYDIVMVDYAVNGREFVPIMIDYIKQVESIYLEGVQVYLIQRLSAEYIENELKTYLNTLYVQISVVQIHQVRTTKGYLHVIIIYFESGEAAVWIEDSALGMKIYKGVDHLGAHGVISNNAQFTDSESSDVSDGEDDEGDYYASTGVEGANEEEKRPDPSEAEMQEFADLKQQFDSEMEKLNKGTANWHKTDYQNAIARFLKVQKNSSALNTRAGPSSVMGEKYLQLFFDSSAALTVVTAKSQEYRDEQRKNRKATGSTKKKRVVAVPPGGFQAEMHQRRARIDPSSGGESESENTSGWTDTEVVGGGYKSSGEDELFGAKLEVPEGRTKEGKTSYRKKRQV